MRIYILMALWLCTASSLVLGQETKNTAQPTIMVVPFAKKGQSIRGAYEHNELARIAITKTKEGFDQRGVNTIDLVGKLKQTNNNAALQEDQASDVKDDVIALSGADIYVVVEASRNYSNSGNSATVILTAYDAFSGESLANKVSNSPKLYTDNYEKLVEKAVEKEIDNLLNTIQEKFTAMLENGRSIVINVGIAEDATLSLDDEVNDDGDLLSDLIEFWVEENAYKGNYHLQGVTGNKMIFDLVKVPVKRPNGSAFKISRFASKFRKHLRKNGIRAKQLIQGSNLVFTLDQE